MKVWVCCRPRRRVTLVRPPDTGKEIARKGRNNRVALEGPGVPRFLSIEASYQVAHPRIRLAYNCNRPRHVATTTTDRFCFHYTYTCDSAWTPH